MGSEVVDVVEAMARLLLVEVWVVAMLAIEVTFLSAKTWVTFVVGDVESAWQATRLA